MYRRACVPSADSYVCTAVRVSPQLTTLRGCILEEVIPTSSRLSSTRGLPPKEILEYVAPDLNLSCLRLATLGSKTADQLTKVDEQGVSGVTGVTLRLVPSRLANFAENRLDKNFEFSLITVYGQFGQIHFDASGNPGSRGGEWGHGG